MKRHEASEHSMSVLQRLKAIKNRMAAQEGADDLTDASSSEAPDPDLTSDAAPKSEEAREQNASSDTERETDDLAETASEDFLSDQLGQTEQSGGAHTPTNVGSMWDLLGDTDDSLEIDVESAPQDHSGLSSFDGSDAAFEAESGAAQPIADDHSPRRASGRAKTRLLSQDQSTQAPKDVFEKTAVSESLVHTQFPVGWVVVVDGPGRGAYVALNPGVSPIGRGDDQAIQLDFGDEAISRSNHAAIAYDPEQRSFFIGHGGKSNLVRVNGRPLLSTEQLTSGDEIRIGETTLRLVALCGEGFSWVGQAGTRNAVNG